MILRLIALVAFSTILTACQSTKPLVQPGIQPKYHALNPSRILAVPVFIVPNPAKQALIDRGALEAGKAISTLEAEVLGAFKDQPGVNGISFSSVRRELGKNPNAWTKLEELLVLNSQKVNSGTKQERDALPEKCHERKNVIDFYMHCLSPVVEWKNALNALSAKVFNADSALIIIVSEANKRVVKERYIVDTTITALLVDTNNANLIWSREGALSETAPLSQRSFPEWDVVFNKIFTEKFWAEFPGRTPKI